MKRTWIGVTLVAASLAAGCGDGRAIFNVDIYSFVKGSVNDSVLYAAPPGNYTVGNPPVKINLVPGLGSSGIDTVKLTGSAEFRNVSGGPATLRFQVYMAKDSAGTYVAGRDSMFAPPLQATNLSGTNTSPAPINIPNLSPTGNALFTNDQIWIRFVVTATNGTLTVAQGRAVLTALSIRLVVQDKLF